jgi:hypothetical protein
MSAYTPPTREQVYQALFALVSGAAGFKTKSRRLQNWDQVASEEKPAIYQIQIAEEPKTDWSGMPYKSHLFAEIYIFVAQNDDVDVVSSLLNPLVDAVEAALQPAITDERQTLGGLVYGVKISGRIEYREGLLGPNAFAVIPIEMLTAELQTE